ncbi:hypothetical protein X797_012312 [Metarhizium robertsii]|uniref:Transcription factor Zn, C2H2 n=2 Tax=Metarhizium robertsii TaxID=568076 RepID=E9FE48_METRA|nr:transcription factor Zn, C2H2 [Metarhizium robertsii ARSEF 23]EFY93993.1 transcription factor Zn, C2H2 [Metarhizium robertsii ARSEF 23]EXU94615.1 hypothetical protein X797_012312 [Metarhizium robertsii]
METPNAIDAYFSSYPKFNYDRNIAAWEEYHRMVQFFRWERDEKREKIARRCFRVAIVKHFAEFVSAMLDIGHVPQTVKSCKEAIEKAHVNIMDFIDSGRTGHPVPKFESVNKLRRYTIKTGKIFPKKEAKKSSLLRYLLRRIFV